MQEAFNKGQCNAQERSVMKCYCGCKYLSDLKLNMNYFRYVQDSTKVSGLKFDYELLQAYK